MAEMGTKLDNNFLRKPVKKEIYEGAVVDIINKEGVRLGKGTLIQRCPSKITTDNLPYIKNELDASGNKTRDKHAHIWSSERWLVEWKEHGYLRPGERSCLPVNYYIHTRINADSGYDINAQVKDDYNKYIFLEENGVLVTPKAHYPKTAIKALNKVYKVYGGELVMYAENQKAARRKCNSSGVKARILSFLDPKQPFEVSISEYVERVNTNEFIIFAGRSKVNHSRVLALDVNKGLCLKKDLKPSRKSAQQ